MFPLSQYYINEIDEMVSKAVLVDSNYGKFEEAFESFGEYAANVNGMPSRSPIVMGVAKKMFGLYAEITGVTMPLGCRPCYAKVFHFFNKSMLAFQKMQEQ